MYVKRHAVRRGGRRYVYLRLVQAYRDEQGRVRHRVLSGRGVTAPDVSALEADTEVAPTLAGGEAFLAAVDDGG